MIGGDQLLASISPNLGVYSFRAGCRSGRRVDEVHAPLPAICRDDQLVLPGHKLPFTRFPIGWGRSTENHEEALARLLEHLGTPRTAVECFSALFRRPIGEGEYGLALVEAVAHLNHLLKAGLIRRTLQDDGAYQWQRMQ